MPDRLRVDTNAALHELEYVVVDVETTGRSYGGMDRVTEVAAVVVRNSVPCESFSALVNPGRWIPPTIVHLTGITNSMVADAPEFYDVAERVNEMLAARVFVAHNAPFDWGFLSAEMLRTTGRELAGDRLCTVRLARRLLSHLPRRNLDAVAAHYGIEIQGRHRALGDARATAQAFAYMLHELGRQGVHTWGELNALLKGRKRRKRTALPTTMFDWSIA